jgi:hypothetical protein
LVFRPALTTGSFVTGTPAAVITLLKAATVSGDGLKFPKR